MARPQAEALADRDVQLSNDPDFESKLVDVVDLRLDPSERAVVFCFDEKTGCQALDRSEPSLPLKPGRAGTITHDYKRNGTVDPFAALGTATGKVLHALRKRHGATDVLACFKLIDTSVPAGLDVRVVLDDLSADKPSEVTNSLARLKQTRWHLHLTPTSSSRLKLVERSFRELTEQRLQRGVFTSLDKLLEALTGWTDNWNVDPKPFVGHKTVEEITAKAQRGRTALARHNFATDH